MGEQAMITCCPRCDWNDREEKMMSEPEDGRLQKLNDVRAVVDWLEAHPEVPLPYDFDYGGFMISNVNTREELRDLARQFGECEKEYSDDSFYLRKRFGTSKLYAVTQRKEVCERVVVGTEEIPERVQPAYVREIVEWRCADPLLSNNGDNHAK